MNKMFLIAKYPVTLRGGRQNEWQHNEEVRCVKNLKTKDWSEASVVLDVANGKVVKNRFNDNDDFEKLYAHYLSHYSDYINRWVVANTKG